MARVVHFEFNVVDTEQAEAFFTQVLGWKITRWEGPEEYLLVSTGGDGEPGIDGAIMRSRDGAPRTVNTVQVDDVDEVAARITATGGQVVVPKTAIPGVGWVVYATEPGGLIFGIHQPDPEAR